MRAGLSRGSYLRSPAGFRKPFFTAGCVIFSQNQSVRRGVDMSTSAAFAAAGATSRQAP